MFFDKYIEEVNVRIGVVKISYINYNLYKFYIVVEMLWMFCKC